MLANDFRLLDKLEEYGAKLMESIAVIKVATQVKSTELISLHKDHDEPTITFVTHVCGKANTCDFTTVSE